MGRPFIIDCDTGTDDAIALIAAFGCRDISVKAITSVNGNVKEEYTSANNLNLAEYLGEQVEVARGAASPLLSKGDYYDSTHGDTGMGNVVLPEAVTSTFSKDMAHQVIRRIAAEEEGKLEILALGPMTNLAIALSLYPDLASRIRHIWFMGGAIRGGNMTTSAEFNIWVDPEAAKQVLQSGIPMTMVGLDVTELAVLDREDADLFRAEGGTGGALAADILEYMFSRNAEGGEDALMHDALALAAAAAPEIMAYKNWFVDVECNGQYTRGHTAVDTRGRTGKEPNVSVATELNLGLFKKWLYQSICKKEG